MRILLAGLALLVAMNAAPALAKGGKGKKVSAAASDPNAVVSRAHGGKVWILATQPPSVEGEELSKWLGSQPAKAELTKKPNEERWRIIYLAVFKRPPARGPMTFQFVDKKEPKFIVDQDVSQIPGEGLVFQEPYDLESDKGFNKNHTYIMKVGQIIKRKFITYATGEVTLK
jgi:hypothetical protein